MKHKHVAINNKMVKKTLGICAERSGVPRSHFVHQFVNQHDYDATMLFWSTLHSEFPVTKIYNDIDYCRGCSAFSLNTVDIPS
jgi:ribosomal protein S26